MADNDFRDPWLVAAWPGMGGVAQIAGTYLVQQLGARVLGELPPDDFFEVKAVGVKHGLVQPAARPRTTFYGWRHPGAGRDLIVALGERQPDQRGYEYCQRLLEHAARWGVTRVFTFAAMASPITPDAASRVVGVATDTDVLGELATAGARVLEGGEIAGLNGVLVGAAAERELPAACLLGEFPYFATPVPNPKASRAILDMFTDLAGIDLDFAALDEQVESIERQLVQLLERLRDEQGLDTSLGMDQPEFPESLAGDDDDDDEDHEEPAASPEPDPPPVVLPPEVEQGIERLFEAARKDRAKALELKAELDRHGVFKRYEDRFLDMFRQGG